MSISSCLCLLRKWCNGYCECFQLANLTSHSTANWILQTPIDRQLMIGESRCMREIKKYLAKVARTDSNVLITGETGTGKELAAELIHFKGPRSNKPFVCINSAAIPETLVESELFGYDRGAFTGAVAEKPGKLELARKGTVFLDEIGDMNHYAQAKILRSIESREFFPFRRKQAGVI